MSETKLPRVIEPVKFAEQRACLEGILALAEMPRLRELCYAGQTLGQAVVSLEGGVDQQGLHYLQGSVMAEVPLQCQRCLEKMVYQIKADFCLSPVYNEAEAEQLPGGYEALYLKKPEADLSTIIEDELLLALPLVPKHAKGECKVKPALQADEEQAAKRPHPFAELKKLKKERL